MTTDKLCACGCGQPIIIKRHHKWKGIPDFIHGHSARIVNGMRGKKHSPETLKKYSEMRKGKKFSEEHKLKISEAQKGRMHTPQTAFKKGNTVCKGIKLTDEHRKKISDSNKGRIMSDYTKAQIRKSHIGKSLSEKHKEKLSIAGKGRKLSIGHKRRISRAKKANWKNVEFCKMMGQAWGSKPNKIETLLIKLLNNLYPGEWKYTGDFSFTINGKCPDFVNCNGQKKIIELFGDYWHRGENPQDRADLFEPFGYKTLVIWEHELKRMKSVINRIHVFMVD